LPNSTQKSTQAPSTNTIVRVAVPLYLPKALDYAWEDATPPQLYQVVAVPVGTKTYHGMVVKILEGEAPNDEPAAPAEEFTLEATPTESKPKKKKFKLKPAKPVGIPLEKPTQNMHFPTATAKFYEWVSRYNFSFPGEGLRAALQAGKLPPEPTPETKLVAHAAFDGKMTPLQQKVHKICVESGPFESQAQLAVAADCSSGVVKALLDKGAIHEVEASLRTIEPTPSNVTLGADQAHAANSVIASMNDKRFTSFLLDGVTGSGKTEVYFEVIQHMLENQDEPDGQALVLLPEISLTPQWLDRFEKRFGFKPNVWHSAIGQGQRKKTWWGALDGTSRVVVGARSALFLPFVNLKLIVVDEEHDPSYKQEEGFRYSGRDMAIVRASLAKCPVLLASATPSLESWHNAQQGRYTLLPLTSRYGNATMPDIQTIDLTKTPMKADTYVSSQLRAAIAKTLEEGQQVALFLNRRGFAPLLICRSCGHRVNCPSCSASLVVHGPKLQCHHCGLTEPYPEECSQCHKPDTLHPFGPGTRKVMQEVQDLFPEARVAAVDRDSINTPEEMRDIVQRMQTQQLDILVGTQMLAKGHDFDHLTLVGVIDADMGLAHGDLRAAERTFQLLTQVAGRAGRRDIKGRVLLQTHTPEHPLFKALIGMDRDAFLNLELRGRQFTGFPPFGRLTALILSGESENAVTAAARTLATTLPTREKTTLYGPAPAPLLKLRDNYRYRLLLRSAEAPHELLREWLGQAELPKGVRVDVDIDPQSFF